MKVDFFVTFLSVMQTKSFTKAAMMTNLSQSTVSNRILELEKHFECKLFERGINKIEATQAAIELVPFAENIVSTYNNATSLINHSKHHTSDLRIASVHAFYDSFLETFLDEYIFQPSAYKVNLSLKHSYEIIQGVVSGKYDIGFVHHPSNYRKFTSKLLYTDELVFVGVEDIPEFREGLDFSMLSDLRVFHSNLFDNYFDDILHDSKVYDFSIDISSRIIPLLIKHKAFAFLPSQYVKPLIDQEVLYCYAIKDYKLPSLEYYILYPNEYNSEDHPKQSVIKELQSLSVYDE